MIDEFMEIKDSLKEAKDAKYEKKADGLKYIKRGKRFNYPDFTFNFSFFRFQY